MRDLEIQHKTQMATNSYSLLQPSELSLVLALTTVFARFLRFLIHQLHLDPHSTFIFRDN